MCWNNAQTLDKTKDVFEGIELSNATQEVKNLEKSSTDCKGLVRQIEKIK